MVENRTNSCVKFIERNNESIWINILRGNKCYSHGGMEKEKQELSLNSSWCYEKHTIVQQLFQILGLRLVVL